MTLAQTAILVGATPKWTLNTLTGGKLGSRPSLATARRLAIARALHLELAVPLRRALVLASQVLAAPERPDGSVRLEMAREGATAIVVDRARLLAAFAMRQALLATTIAPRHRGRPPRRRKDAITRATEWGLDLSLLRANLRLTPAERLRQLDAMAAFARGVRRNVSTQG